ncbi:MAG: hypothetical protein CMJ49_13755 [Planctomycetaceae bacterium]|nr:hypothetical protein [Planctomycetaceae bacterium]
MRLAFLFNMILIGAILGALPTPAGGQPTDAPTLSPEQRQARDTLLDPTADDLTRLEALLTFAPSREVGQPGNAALEALFAQRLAQAAETHNQSRDPTQWQQAQVLLARADAADRRIIELIDATQVQSAATTLQSPWYIRYPLEDAGVLISALVVVAILLCLTWYYQRRPALVIATVVVVGAAIALFVVSVTWNTPIEDINRAGRLQQDLIDAQAAKDNFAARITTLTEQRGQATKQLAEPADDTPSPEILQQRIDTIDRDLVEANEGLAERREFITNTQLHIAEWETQLQADLAAITPDIEALDQDTARLTEQLQPFEDQLSVRKGELAELRAAEETDDQRISDLEARILEVDEQAEPHRQALEAHEDQARPLRRQHRFLNATLAALTGGEGIQTVEKKQRDLAAARRQALVADLRAASAARGMWLSGEIQHAAAAFVPGAGRLTTQNKVDVPLFQLAPNLVEPGNLPETGFTGPIVYVGKATPADLAGRNLEGAAVLVDADCDRRWLSPVQLGAQVVIVREPTHRPMEYIQAALKRTTSPVSIPRFYLRHADLLAAFGPDWATALSQAPQITVQQTPGRWVDHNVRTSWLFIPGSTPSTPDATVGKDPARQLVHLQTYLDAASIVPDLSPGANSATNLVLMLRLLEQFESAPPIRPVLISIVNDHANALSGEEMFAHVAFTDVKSVLAELENIDLDLAAWAYIHDLYKHPPTRKLIEDIRFREEMVGGKNLKAKAAIADDYLTHMRNITRERLNGIEAQLRELPEGENPDPLEAQKKQTLKEADDLVTLLNLFKKIGAPQQFDELTAAHHAQLDQTFANIAEEAGRERDVLDRTRRQQRRNLQLRRRLLVLNPELIDQADRGQLTEISDDDVVATRLTPLTAIAMLSLDLTVGTDQVGFFHTGNQYALAGTLTEVVANRGRVKRLAVETLSVAHDWATSRDQPSLLVDTIRGTNWPWGAYMGGGFAIAANVTHQHLQPALTLTGVRDQRANTFTPHDDLTNLNIDNYGRIMAFTSSYLPLLVNSKDLGTTLETAGTAAPYTLELTVRLLDKYAVTIPKIRVSGAVVVAPIGAPPLGTINHWMLGQVRPWHVSLTDETGRTWLRGATTAGASLQVFSYSDDFRSVETALDLGTEGESRFPSTVAGSTTAFFKTASVLAFPCKKIDLIGLTSALTLDAEKSVTILDARQDSTPRFYGISGMLATASTKVVPNSLDGTASIFMDPGTPFKLRIGPITAAQTPAINATDDDPEGVGFPADIGIVRDITLTSAQDMYRLTDSRLRLLKSKGVENKTAQNFHEEARKAIDQLEDPAIANRNDLRLNLGEKARGLEYQAYTRGLGTINDLIRAVIIFLALVIPFCFFTMKLITPFTEVSRQLFGFALIFLVMAITLQIVHPAFKIAQTPYIVILAFVILGLAGYVAMVVIGRFNASMNQAVEESQMAESGDAPQGRLAGAAFMVGVNNMKRRRIRTTLTCVTIVLVTFTMLSVISVGQNTEPIKLRRTSEAPYNGFIFTMPGLAPIPVNRVERLRAHFAEQTTVARAWGQRQGAKKDYLPYEIRPHNPIPGADARKLDATVLVGLEQAEDGFLRSLSGVDGILTAGRWFSSNDAPELILSAKAASVIGLDDSNFNDARFDLHGRAVELIGLIDDERMTKLEDLGEVQILPMLVDPKREGGADAATDATASDIALEGRSLSDIVGANPAEPKNVAFLPIDFVMDTGEASYRTLSVKYETPVDAGLTASEAAKLAAEQAWADTSDMIQFQTIRLIVSLQQQVIYGEQQTKMSAGQYAVASSNSAQVGGVVKVAIPVILAATIILNTMLGSVMERRREISIYNAIGLNPSHVMVFFLAESLVFGVVGAVAGYLIGQILSVVIAALWPNTLNLNYSSLSVMVVIFLSIGTVLASTIYPALMAARAAVPSGQRRWSLPQPDGDEITIKFPFSYDAERVLGICAYLRDYMRQNSDASTGKFLARLGPVGKVPVPDAPPNADPAASEAYVMLFDIAPAPFDLGVNQSMEVYAYYDAHIRAHMLSVHLKRISGERSNWVTVNQPFLESLRKRLLNWRSQRTDTQRTFFEIGEQLFRNARVFHAEPEPQTRS